MLSSLDQGFLGLDFIDNEAAFVDDDATIFTFQIADLVDHLSFDQMKANSAVNKDVRRQKYLTPTKNLFKDVLESVRAKTGMEKGQFLR